ncbi:hypothetical protein BDK51DRAFT_43690 [Blyttiomyces helicus]|uniref:Uncharacterized protein n=1 Tax=Blyttiomyces helicus TaxID=388810 RepID=A0A4P9WHL3_9FUNG|nr:hypothetical protein BDK51DRAFT_43690 [Blyttiomyces helicus]|eukprot:RKO90590.1 hypothetical protein BDK51DRAFT_43690 [Blyttiomyces helicus]
MSLSLVDYASSSDDDSDTEVAPRPAAAPAPPPPAPAPTARTSLFGTLPPPSSTTSATKRKKVVIPFADHSTLPKSTDPDSDDEDRRKRAKPAEAPARSGSGLFALLPPPKKPAVSLGTVAGGGGGGGPVGARLAVKSVASMVPYSLSRKAAGGGASGGEGKAGSGRTKAEKSEDAEKMDESYSFFSLGKRWAIGGEKEPEYEEPLPAKAAPPPQHPAPAPSASSQYAYPNASNAAYAQPAYYGAEEESSSYYVEQPVEARNDVISDEAMRKLVGRRSKEGPIQFKEVFRSEMIDETTWRLESARQASMEKPTSMEGFKVISIFPSRTRIRIIHRI